MKTMPYIALLYSLIVILSGMISFAYENNLIALIVESLCGAIIFANVFCMIREKRASYYILCALSILLEINYGYIFFRSPYFFSGLLAALSFFIFISSLLKTFNFE